jgi:hypothetical protein
MGLGRENDISQRGEKSLKRDLRDVDFEAMSVYRLARDGERLDALLERRDLEVGLVEVCAAESRSFAYHVSSAEFLANVGGDGYQPEPWDGTSLRGLHCIVPRVVRTH